MAWWCTKSGDGGLKERLRKLLLDDLYLLSAIFGSYAILSIANEEFDLLIIVVVVVIIIVAKINGKYSGLTQKFSNFVLFVFKTLSLMMPS